MALVSTTSSEQLKSLTRNPLPGLRTVAFTARFITRSGFQYRVDRLMPRPGIDVPVVFSTGCCTRHSTPATKLIPIWFISFHLLSLVCLIQSERVSLPTSYRPWLVVTAAISLRCGGISQHPAVAPCHDSQQSHTGAQVSFFVDFPACVDEFWQSSGLN